MTTFMQSLKKEIDGNRKKNGYGKNTYGGGYKKNYQNQSPGGPDRTPKPPAYSVPLAQLEDLLGESMVSIQKLMEQVIETQKCLMENEQRRIGFEKETTSILKRIADMLAALIERQGDSGARYAPPQGERSAAVPPAWNAPHAGDALSGLADPEHCRYITVNRKDVVQKIIAMREQGLAYRVIAEYLEQNNIPTFSGRGGWHAQTIANLIKFSKTEEY